MQNIQIRIPRTSRTLGLVFFILTFLIVSSFTIFSYLNCKVDTSGTCGLEVVLANFPMINIYKLYIFLIPFWSNVPKSVDLSILILSNSIFWALVGVIIALGINSLIFLFKNIFDKKSHGFTLIELLVVISIIGLLSSIVLTSIKESKDKAKASTFRREINQFITALEMYKHDKGKYPSRYSTLETYQVSGTGVIAGYPNNDVIPLNTMMDAYIPKIPKPSDSQAYFIYYSNPGYSCLMDGSKPDYFLIVSKSQAGFENWENGVSGFSNYKCFFLK